MGHQKWIWLPCESEQQGRSIRLEQGPPPLQEFPLLDNSLSNSKYKCMFNVQLTKYYK